MLQIFGKPVVNSHPRSKRYSCVWRKRDTVCTTQFWRRRCPVPSSS